MQVDVKTSETNLQGDGTPQVPILGRNSTEIQESRLTKYTENELSAAAPKNRKFEPVVKSKTYKSLNKQHHNFEATTQSHDAMKSPPDAESRPVEEDAEGHLVNIKLENSSTDGNVLVQEAECQTGDQDQGIQVKKEKV